MPTQALALLLSAFSFTNRHVVKSAVKTTAPRRRSQESIGRPGAWQSVTPSICT
jgi:hypothetical protein